MPILRYLEACKDEKDRSVFRKAGQSFETLSKAYLTIKITKRKIKWKKMGVGGGGGGLS